MGLPPQELPTIRQRRRRQLVGFDLTAPVEELCIPQHALIDKVQLRMELPIRFASRQSVDDYVSLIADNSGVDTPLFNPPSRETPRSVKFIVSRGWHFSGQALLAFNENFRGRLNIVLSINPTRWIDQRGHLNLTQLNSLSPDILLRESSEISSDALDANDNLLRGFDSVGDPLSDPRVDRFTQYIAAYRTTLERFFSARLVPSPLGVLPNDVTISEIVLPRPHYAECYHEFFAEDAISVVEGLRGASWARFANVSWQTRHMRVGSAQMRNSNSVSIPITKACMISIYAKTSRRVRIEVRYSGRLSQFAFPRDLPGAQRTFEQLFAGLQINATDRIKRLLQSLAPQAHVVVQRMDMLDLLDAVYRALEHDRTKARMLLAALANTGGVTETAENGILPSHALRSLLQRGILQRRVITHGNAFQGQRRYSLTASYAAAAARFAEAE